MTIFLTFPTLIFLFFQIQEAFHHAGVEMAASKQAQVFLGICAWGKFARVQAQEKPRSPTIGRSQMDLYKKWRPGEDVILEFPECCVCHEEFKKGFQLAAAVELIIYRRLVDHRNFNAEL